MTISEAKEHLSSLTGHITFEYNGQPCGVDPLALDSFSLWYGSHETTCKSVHEVMNVAIFDGKTLIEIWHDIAELNA